MITNIKKEKFEDYDGFVEKFKPKKTTDDCYTPPKMYEAIKDWVVKEYKLQDKKIIRPFYPGGDYENYDYSENCVVIDNPPFSILSKICDFYIKNNIKFFLFAPALTIFSSNTKGKKYIITDSEIIYENGANVKTSFITNLDKYLIRTSCELKKIIKDAQKKTDKKALPKYTYPKDIITASRLKKTINKGREFTLKEDECHFIRTLDEQRKYKKGIYGGGFLISKSKQKELEELEELEAYIFKLSQREQEIVNNLK